MIKIQFMPKSRKLCIVEKIKSDYIDARDYSDICAGTLICDAIQRVRSVLSSPLLKITIGNRAFEISSKYRFSTYRFWHIPSKECAKKITDRELSRIISKGRIKYD